MLFGQKNLVAFSGGVDSTVLLHQMVNVRESNPDIQLRAIHINHQLSPNADQWEAHCKAICEKWQVPVTCLRVDAKHEVGESPEEAARIARHLAFAETLESNEYLLTAHNADDQAETVILQLLRSAGPKGLSAMPETIEFVNGFLVRPLLHLTRDDILTYANENALEWVEDESNQFDKYDRNFLRNNIIPQIKNRWPQYATTISRSAQNNAEANYLLEVLAHQDLEHCLDDQHCIMISRLNTLDEARQKNLIRFYLDEHFCIKISAKKLEEFLTNFLHADEDRNPMLVLDDLVLRRYQDSVVPTSEIPDHDPTQVIEWDLKNTLVLPHDIGELNPDDFDIDTAEKVTVRFRQGGEVCRPKGRKHAHALKKLFQEWGVPPWLRDQVPLIYVGDDIAYIVGYCECEICAIIECNTEVIL